MCIEGRRFSLVYSRREEESCSLPNFMNVNRHRVLKHLCVSTWTRSFLKKIIFLIKQQRLSWNIYIIDPQGFLFTATTLHSHDNFDPSRRKYVKMDDMSKATNIRNADMVIILTYVQGELKNLE